MMNYGYPLLFTDIDGVLNDHTQHANGYCGTLPTCVAQFNRILAETDAHLVISSAWRYLYWQNSMYLTGFESLLLTHGVNCRGRIDGFTRRDRDRDEPRSRQIEEYLKIAKFWGRYCVLDDQDLGFTDAHLVFVQTDGKVGLTEADADRVIAILKGEPTP